MIKVAFDPSFVHPLPEGHRFPMEKYDLLPKQLLLEGTLEEPDFFAPEPIDLSIAHLVHKETYTSDLIGLKLSSREQRKTGFVHSESLIDRELRIMEGTRECAAFALKNNGVGMNIAGGTHHAFSDRGEGFCMLNDQAIAAKWLLENELVKSVLIIDLDVHQGNGTAEILAGEPDVFTFSMHGEHNYPLHKEKSDLDVPVKDGTGDKEYLDILERNLGNILNRFTPGFVFYQSGVDVLASDKLGRLAMSLQGCMERDRIVFSAVKQLGVPVVCSMGGGYSPEIRTIIEAHANTFRTVRKILS